MDPTFKAVCLVAAFAAFVIEAVRARSILSGGLALFSAPAAWDAVEAA